MCVGTVTYWFQTPWPARRREDVRLCGRTEREGILQVQARETQVERLVRTAHTLAMDLEREGGGPAQTPGKNGTGCQKDTGDVQKGQRLDNNSMASMC